MFETWTGAEANAIDSIGPTERWDGENMLSVVDLWTATRSIMTVG